MSDAKQLRMKRETVRSAMERIGGFRGIEILPCIGADKPEHYRNKAVFQFANAEKTNQSPAFLFFIESADAEQIRPFGNDSFRRHCLFVLNHACFNGHEFMAFLFVISRKNLPKVLQPA